MIARLGRLCLLASLLGFVLPGDRLIEQLDRHHRTLAPLHIEATLSGLGLDWPTRLTLEMHPDFGLRVSTATYGRYLVRHGQLVAGSRPGVPVWVPNIEILVLRGPKAIRQWLRQAGVDPSLNELARCGKSDCFVLGSRRSPARVWIDKDRFEPLRIVFPGERRIEFLDYQDWEGIRFPREIRIVDAQGSIAAFVVGTVVPRSGLGAQDFSTRWVVSEPR